MPRRSPASRRKVSFGPCVARRVYVWRPAGQRARRVTLEIGTPGPAAQYEWICRVRIRGLSKKVDKECRGIDGIQALEQALVFAGKHLSETPEFKAVEIEQFGEPVVHAAELFLPLPVRMLQMTLENLRAFLERGTAESPQRNDWRQNLLTAMNEINAGLTELRERLPADG